MAADKIYAVLRSRAPETLTGGQFRPAAVLVPVQERADGDYLVLTQRAEMLNSHQGQVAFPGGRIDARDSDPLAAALRESHEEIGIAPGDVRVLGQLDQVTAASNYLVTPFVGLIPHPYEFRLNLSETAAVFTVPIAALLQPGSFKAEPRLFPSNRRDPIYHFYYEGWDIWGATARIIIQLLELAYGFEPRKNPE
jgi:8-oxo-dGTP pyrophosphatase MutT (NUDIX family)